MKLRWKIALGLVALILISCLLLFSGLSRAQRELEATRRSLRKQGFKIALAEFDFSTSPEIRARAAILAATTRAAMTNRSRPEPVFSRETPRMMMPAGPKVALIAWKQPQ